MLKRPKMPLAKKISKSKDEEKAGIKVKQIRGFAENVFEICDFSDHESNQYFILQQVRDLKRRNF